ncbi:metal ABC transporter ATP-binding protein [Marinomonas algarum]|uniref:ATP-binding cassette domain-containing protein n=1 Tax=Marinomonas algarum TaxID=2883105 RepID=A0A9X1LFJ4_9GAMM|nr:ATP-binding cassette domain-containing protein [Marinomonas algarum]MCB5162985.1 ATP-binding cassette domain-containing protein [Marinomonas algarum]
MKGPIIEMQAMHFGYPQSEAVFEGINFAVFEGDFLALIGPNGGGKTTLLKLMLGLLTPSKGQITVFNNTLSSANPKLGYVPQFASHIQDFPLTVWQFVSQGRLNSGRHNFWLTRTDKKQIQHALKATNTEHFAKRSLTQLSGGQKQRVLIARALASEPQVLLLDEPTAHLDTSSSLKIFDLLTELNQHTTLVLVSHDMELVNRYANKVVNVNHGLSWQPSKNMNNLEANHQ